METTNELLIEVFERLRQYETAVTELWIEVRALKEAFPEDRRAVLDQSRDKGLRAASLASHRTLSRYSEIIERLKRNQ